MLLTAGIPNTCLREAIVSLRSDGTREGWQVGREMSFSFVFDKMLMLRHLVALAYRLICIQESLSSKECHNIRSLQ